MSSCFCRCKGRRIHVSTGRGDQTGKELLVLGLKGAGKSHLLRAVCGLATGRQREIHNLSPTVGVELYHVRRHRRSKRNAVQAREVGGCMIPIWQQYFDCAHSLLYILNVTESETFATAVTELQQALTHPEMQVQPACVVLNHCDQVGVDTTTPAIMHMQDVFDIQQLREGRVGPIFVVDTEQEGLSVVQQVLDWILLP